MTDLLLVRQPEHATWSVGFRTDVLKSWAGKESRVALLRDPREDWQADYRLSEAELRLWRRTLYLDPTTRALIPFRQESALATAAVTSTTVAADLTYLDWLDSEQDVLVENDRGDYYQTQLLAAGGGSMTLADSPPVGKTFPANRTRVSPLYPVQPADNEPFGRYRVNVGDWRLSGYVDRFRQTWGTGASLTTFDGYNVLDIAPLNAELAQEQNQGGVEILDQGAVRQAGWSRDFSDVRRDHDFQWRTPADRQQWKKLIYALKGQQKTFLLPTWRDDLILRSHPSPGATSLVVEETADYVAWFASAAQRRLQLQHTNRSVQYVRVTAAVASGAGTQTLTITPAVGAGTISRVSFLELARQGDDAVAFTLGSGNLAAHKLTAMVVQQ